MYKSNALLFSYVVLLDGPVVFGVFGKPAEASLCILSGAIGLAFVNIDKIKRFKGGGFEAEMKEKVDAMVAKEAEPDEEAEDSGFKLLGFSFDENIRKVLSALNNSNYTWRSVDKISQESCLTRNIVIRSLKWLEDNGLAMHVGVSKRINWGLTEQGRDIANSMFKPASNDG